MPVIRCDFCNGAGYLVEGGDLHDCPMCQGSGRLTELEPAPIPEPETIRYLCSACLGEGYVEDARQGRMCRGCAGTGVFILEAGTNFETEASVDVRTLDQIAAADARFNRWFNTYLARPSLSEVKTDQYDEDW